MVTVSNLDDALRVVCTHAGGIPAGPVIDIAFDLCQGGKKPVSSDFPRTVEGCASGFGPLSGCECSAALRSSRRLGDGTVPVPPIYPDGTPLKRARL
jgi:hypothetical protein